MADLTLSTNNVALHALDQIQRDRNGKRRPSSRRFKRADRNATLVRELFPNAASEDFEVYMELDGAVFLGIAVVDNRTGEVVTQVSVAELSKQADHPGLIFERVA